MFWDQQILYTYDISLLPTALQDKIFMKLWKPLSFTPDSFHTNNPSTGRDILSPWRSEIGVCLKWSQKYLVKKGLQQAHNNNKSQTKWQWKPQHNPLMDLFKEALVQLICRICCLLILMLRPYQGMLHWIYLCVISRFARNYIWNRGYNWSPWNSSRCRLLCAPL